jgi:hypothetical protein
VPKEVSNVITVLHAGTFLGTDITDAVNGAFIISALLEAGFAYVVSGSSKIVATLSLFRSVLYVGTDIFHPMAKTVSH